MPLSFRNKYSILLIGIARITSTATVRPSYALSGNIAFLFTGKSIVTPTLVSMKCDKNTSSQALHEDDIIISSSKHEQYPWGYLSAAAAAALDEELMNPSSYSYTLEQLMELAGLSVAQAVHHVLSTRSMSTNDDTSVPPELSSATTATKSTPPPPPPPTTTTTTTTASTTLQASSALVICGPGNNGGDGLVAARHLALFGMDQVTVVYPKPGRSSHYSKLLQQCRDMGVIITSELPEEEAKLCSYTIIIDAIFGFSFQGTPREPFDTILPKLARLSTQSSSSEHQVPLIVAVDIPSGWHVEDGNTTADNAYHPHVLVSLTAPKLCARYFHGRHYVGGRFLPNALAHKYNVQMPPYPDTMQVMEIPVIQYQ
jgi:NAD(P)H-hydrate epimerase